jgi:hypothetical protein
MLSVKGAREVERPEKEKYPASFPSWYWKTATPPIVPLPVGPGFTTSA